MKTSFSKKKGNRYQGKKVTLNKPFYTPGERVAIVDAWTGDTLVAFPDAYEG